MGTYAQTSDCTYVEKIFKSITDPELTGADSKLKFEFISENVYKRQVQDAVVDRSGITGEKMELDGYMTVEGVCTAVYNHMNRNCLLYTSTTLLW